MNKEQILLLMGAGYTQAQIAKLTEEDVQAILANAELEAADYMIRTF